MQNKDITGGEVEALKTKICQHVLGGQDNKIVRHGLLHAAISETIDYLASKGHLKTTGEDDWQPFSKELLDKALSEPGQWEIRIRSGV
jgi:hypothetical protein